MRAAPTKNANYVPLQIVVNAVMIIAKSVAMANTSTQTRLVWMRVKLKTASIVTNFPMALCSVQLAVYLNASTAQTILAYSAQVNTTSFTIRAAWTRARIKPVSLATFILMGQKSAKRAPQIIARDAQTMCALCAMATTCISMITEAVLVHATPQIDSI